MIDNSNKHTENFDNKVTFSSPFLGGATSRVIYRFVIERYEIFTSKYGRDYLKFVFLLSNENETFEEDQIFPIGLSNNYSPRFEEFVKQFSQFCELTDDNTFNDFIGEKGECYIDLSHYNGRTYRKLIITALEDNGNE